MTNTLHRYGSRESLKDDYIVFVMSARGINDQGQEAKLRAFLEASLKYHPVNMGNSAVGGIYRPDKTLNLFKLYFSKRNHKTPEKQVIAETTSGTTAVVFDNKEAFEGFLKEVKGLDLGLSTNVSAVVDDTRHACQQTGICPHSVEYSLGFRGKQDKLPTGQTLELSTMCGHGMVSSNYAQKMLLMVKEGRVSPDQASKYMAKFCVCGVFNVSRAKRLMEQDKVTN